MQYDSDTLELMPTPSAVSRHGDEAKVWLPGEVSYGGDEVARIARTIRARIKEWRRQRNGAQG